MADIELAGRVIASHYAEPLVRICVAETPLLASPDDPGPYDMLHAGQSFAVLECGRGLAWGYRVDGHLVGYVDENKLS
ncbi:MAG: hypothetical protein AVDCRST_MAG91-2927 [uncultured Sphingomonadaceae bacterium]|uniref:SH3 domain-containing protein n=1 Tax=uncultured Sphingomonadaceae bacterium TaxID=169976 RepID=A0A6J4TTI8_9SPHN|nr:MAG: hypothetical protein AVDCRST_MAG91-2927 [uncultured Sphingomonadaceae bacterium]